MFSFKKYFYRQIILYTFAYFTPGLQRKIKDTDTCRKKNYIKYTEEMHRKWEKVSNLLKSIPFFVCLITRVHWGQSVLLQPGYQMGTIANELWLVVVFYVSIMRSKCFLLHDRAKHVIF